MQQYSYLWRIIGLLVLLLLARFTSHPKPVAAAGGLDGSAMPAPG